VPLLHGSLTLARFLIHGGAPRRLDQGVIDKLADHAIGRRKEPGDGIDAGWSGGLHVLDTTFDLSKNVLDDCLHFGLRIDTARCPPELMRAYVRMELEALLADRPDARPTARHRRAARDAARRRAELEIRQGRFRRMREYSVMIDSPRDTLLIAATSSSVHEQLHPLFKATFGKRLEPLTSGRLAWRYAEEQGQMRRLENLSPAEFVKFPGGEGQPGVYWTLHDPASRDFLGNEFLLWLWWKADEEGGEIALPDASQAAVVFVRQLVLECPWGQNGKDSILADGPARLPEARRAIRGGKLPRRAGLIVQHRGEQFEFGLLAESLAVSGANLPKPDEKDRNGSEPDPRERIGRIRDLCTAIDGLFGAFLKQRLEGEFADRVKIVRWLKSVD